MTWAPGRTSRPSTMGSRALVMAMTMSASDTAAATSPTGLAASPCRSLTCAAKLSARSLVRLQTSSRPIGRTRETAST